MQAVCRSSLAAVRQRDFTALNRDSRPRRAALHCSAPELRSAELSPNTLLVRAWRSLIELRIDDALASVARFEDEIARGDAPVAPGSLEFAGGLSAVLLVLKGRDGATVRAALAAARAQQREGTLPDRPSRVAEALSPREHRVLRSMSCGLSNKRIAQELQIAPETVKSHVKGIFIKLAVQSRAHAVSTAGALGLL
jgi:ATP/maltotriose-dependent transcriptional regulator MalT